MENPNLMLDFKKPDSFTPISGFFRFSKVHIKFHIRICFPRQKSTLSSNLNSKLTKSEFQKTEFGVYGNIIVIFHKNITSGLKNYEDSEYELRFWKIWTPKTNIGVFRAFFRTIYKNPTSVFGILIFQNLSSYLKSS